MTPMEAAMRTWHSARITLATRLYARRGRTHSDTTIAQGDVEGVIQSLVRWKTPEAMRIYARMEPELYANYIDMATDAGVVSGGAAGFHFSSEAAAVRRLSCWHRPPAPCSASA